MHRAANLLLLATLSLLASCGERRWSVPHEPTLGWNLAAEPHLPLRIAADLVIKRVQFGILETSADGEEHFTPAQELPAEDGLVFGWKIEVDTTRPSLRWQEHLQLPRAPADWGDVATDQDVLISKDGKSVLAQGEDLLENGELSRFYWSLASGDPAGAYQLDLAVEGRPIAHFSFKVPSSVQEKAILVKNRGTARPAPQLAQLVPAGAGNGAPEWR